MIAHFRIFGSLKVSSSLCQIYTDWANHYLAKSGKEQLIKDLQQDVSDGVLLAEIIQVVGMNQFSVLCEQKKQANKK